MIINEILLEEPQRGDSIDIEFGDILIESVIEDITRDGVVIRLDETAMRLMIESKQQLDEITRRGMLRGLGGLAIAGIAGDAMGKVTLGQPVLTMKDEENGTLLYQGKQIPVLNLFKKGMNVRTMTQPIKANYNNKLINVIVVSDDKAYIQSSEKFNPFQQNEAEDKKDKSKKKEVAEGYDSTELTRKKAEEISGDIFVHKNIGPTNRELKEYLDDYNARRYDFYNPGELLEKGVARFSILFFVPKGYENTYDQLKPYRDIHEIFMKVVWPLRRQDPAYRISQPIADPVKVVDNYKDPMFRQPQSGTIFAFKFGFAAPTKQGMAEAEYQGRKVPLGKPMAGDVKKSKVYVKGPKGNVVKVNFGDKNMRIKKSNPKRRKSFRARHNCANPGPRWKARYWSCRMW